MKTSHQFAQELLAGPDLPIMLPIAKTYEEANDGDACVVGDPVVVKHDAASRRTPTPVLIISTQL